MILRNAFRRWFIFLILAFFSPKTITAWAQEPTTAQAELSMVTLRVGKTAIQAELALSSMQKATGLMFRSRMEDNHGMLFFFRTPQPVGFWMRNTRLPLTVAYLDAEGRILELHDLQPFDTTTVASRSSTVSLALEMNQGWFELNGVKENDVIRPEKGSWAELFQRIPREP